MMNLIKKIGSFHLTSTALRVCGILFLAAGMFGYLIQAHVLGAGSISNLELLDALQADSSLMAYATVAVIGQALEACAVPIFAFLLVEGAGHTSNFVRYFLRVLGLAVICQLPYNLVMAGSLLKLHGLNPVLGVVMSMVMLFFFQRFPGKNVSHIAIKFCAILFAFLWSNMLGISHGAACIITTAVLWGFRGKQNLQTIFGMIAILCCAIFSMFYMVAPISFLLLHFYGGAKGRNNCVVNYAAYPALLLIFGLISILR